MYTILPDGRVRFRRPYPVDIERRRNVRRAMFNANIDSIKELAMLIGLPVSTLSEVISGIRHSITIENRIASFFGMEHDALFPPRTQKQMILMEDEAARRRKKRRAA